MASDGFARRRLVVTIPAFNEVEHIGAVIDEIPREIKGFDSVCVLVVDDGSSDGTSEAARAAGADWVLRNPANMGLGYSFQRALSEATKRGADVIVNTDADNHYDQSAIPELVEPILEGSADIVIGSRVLSREDMPASRYHGNRLANGLMQRILGLPGIDASTGFRAYSREAALRMFVPSRYTYTHETLLSAIDQRLVMANHPVPARKVTRPSRLMSSVPNHILRAGSVIAKALLIYRPLSAYPLLAAIVAIPGLLALGRFLIEFAQGNGAGHTQSLVIGMSLIVIASQIAILGLVAYAIRGNRWLLQEVLRNSKDLLARGEAIEEPGPRTMERAAGDRRQRLQPVARTGTDQSRSPSSWST
jgi:hypothetical protein